MIIDRQHFFGFADIMQSLGFVDNQVNRGTGSLKG